MKYIISVGKYWKRKDGGGGGKATVICKLLEKIR